MFIDIVQRSLGERSQVVLCVSWLRSKGQLVFIHTAHIGQTLEENSVISPEPHPRKVFGRFCNSRGTSILESFT